ncbi:MAG: hypothetical protein P8X74_22905 [Reinekea sp.]
MTAKLAGYPIAWRSVHRQYTDAEKSIRLVICPASTLKSRIQV